MDQRPTQSIWMQRAVPDFAEVSENLTTDVVIIGAGVTGLLSAYRLLKEGKNVVVVDDGAVASGETERTTAHLTTLLDYRYFELEQLHGTDNARLVAESHKASVALLEDIIRTESIDCDFKRIDGYLFSNPFKYQAEHDGKRESSNEPSSEPESATEVDSNELAKELESFGRVGIDGAEVTAVAGWGAPINALRVPDQAQLHPLKFFAGLVAAITQAGGKIYCRCHINEIKDGELVELHTGNGRVIRASSAIVATNSPISNWVAIHTKLAAYRTYVIGAQVNANIPEGLFWDTDKPYHYLRSHQVDQKKYVIIGGEDHRTGQNNDFEERFDKLENWARQMLPQLSPIEFRWSGQVYEPIDGLPYIGLDPGHGSNVYVATGMSGMGMVQGALAAIIIGDLIMQRENPWREIYQPTRKTMASLGEYIKENFSTATQYLDHLNGTVTQIQNLEPGQGTVISQGLNKIAVHRTLNGSTLSCSAICPHLKAVLKWNALEQSWDCPAHGSRFDSCGQVIDGPANANLDASEISSPMDALINPPMAAFD